jgi:hypothetical protein
VAQVVYSQMWEPSLPEQRIEMTLDVAGIDARPDP